MKLSSHDFSISQEYKYEVKQSQIPLIIHNNEKKGKKPPTENSLMLQQKIVKFHKLKWLVRK